jgi:PAS domain S-box-containing protein
MVNGSQVQDVATLAERVAFEELIIRISSEFINVDASETDRCIYEALAEIGEYAGVDRSYVFLFSPDKAMMDNSHEWCAPGIASQAHRLHNAPVSALPTFTETVLRGEVMHVPSTAALPESASVDAAELRLQDIQSLILVPMISRGEPIGFLGFDVVRCEKAWSDNDIRLLTIVGQIFVNALERKWTDEALRERELHYRTIFETTSDGLVIVDQQTSRVLAANPAMCRMHGYADGEMIGLPRKAFIHPDYHTFIADYVRMTKAGRSHRVKAIDVRKDGSLLHVEVHGNPIVFQGKQAVLGVVRDISNDVRAYELLEERVAERTKELSLLLDISRNVTSTLELQPLLELILDQLRTVVDYTGTAILSLEGDALVIAGQRGPLSDDVARQMRHPVAAMTPVWERLHRGEAIVIPDVRGESLEAEVFRAAMGVPLDEHFAFIGSCLWAPMIVKDRLIGVMSVASDTVGDFGPRQVELAAAIARQAAVAIENARLFEQAQGKAALEERQKLARELHDSVSQALYGIALGAQTARRLLENDPAKAVGPTDYVLQLAEAGLAEMRALIFELRPESLATEGLVAALEKQAAALRARYGIEVSVDLPEEPAIALDVKEALYRIGQEALHNTMKHARASRSWLCLTLTAGEIMLEVADNGCGFDPDGSYPGHLGLQSMRERLIRFNGRLEITSAPGEGARIRAIVPAQVGVASD